MKIAIVVVLFNNPDLIQKQVECIRRFCKDEHDIILVDNSRRKEAIDAILYYNHSLKCQYYKTESEIDSSYSHAFACNFSFHKLKYNYDYFLFLDHDNFPVKEFSVKEILQDKIIAGLGQVRLDKHYFWAGCVMFNHTKIEENLIDLSPNREFELDTGGNLYKVVDKYGKEACGFFNEVHVQNPYFDKSYYNFYSMINDGVFMHFFNSSNWANALDDTERINSLLNILNEKMKI